MPPGACCRKTAERQSESARVATRLNAGAATVHSTLASGAVAGRSPATDVLRRDALEAVAHELAGARGFGRSLAVVALELGGLDEVTERLGREAADAALIDTAGQLDRSLSTGSVHRLGATTFALVLPGSGIEEAEALVDALQSSLAPPRDETRLVLSAGITEIGADEDADTGLGRAEHGLWQARQAGAGTIVVAVPNRPAPPR